MSSLGPYPPPPAAPPRPGGGVPGWLLAAVTALAVAMAGALVYDVVHLGDHHAAPPLASTHTTAHRTHRHHYPRHWDERILPEVRIAERRRGLHFRHPVPVRFLAPAAFTRTLTREDHLTAADRREQQRSTEELRAVGLLSGHVDLARAEDDFSGSAVLAYYSFRTRSITVRGHDITPSVEATLVHELTHVLQDQHYRVGAELRRLDHHQSSTVDTSEVLRALTEGDAQRTEHSYAYSLPAARRRALAAAQQAEADRAKPGLERLPKILVAMETSPYSLGEGLVRAVAQNGGNQAVGQLLRHPPSHDVALLDPFRVVDHRAGALPVATPALGPGERRVDHSDFGGLMWYLMLSARLPARTALHAADGWGGDAYLGYRSEGRTCGRIAYRGLTSGDTTTMAAALRQWVAAGPTLGAVVRQTGDVVTFQSCDPGTAGAAVTGDFQAALDLLATRTMLTVGLIEGSIPESQARCLAGRLIDTYSTTQLQDPTFGGDAPVQTRIRALASECATGF